MSLFLLVVNFYQLVWPDTRVPPKLAGIEMLHQFIQESPYAVVLLRGPSYGFVAHGADAAHLQPLYQTPVKNNTDRRDINWGAFQQMSHASHTCDPCTGVH